MKKVMASAGLLALGAVGVQSVHGQLLAGADKPWSVSGTLRGFYDDNYNTAPSGPSKRSSVGFEVSPTASFNMPLDQTSISFNYNFSMKYYDDRPKNKADYTHVFELLFTHQFNERYSLDASDSFVIAQEPSLIDPGNSLPIRSNGNNDRNNGAINFHATITPLLGIVLGYANTIYDYEQAGPASYSAELDRMEHLVTFDTRWQIFQETIGVVGGKFGAVSYASSDSLDIAGNPFINPNTRNNRAYIGYIGADHSFRRDLTGTVRVGVQITEYPNDSSQGSSLSPYVDLSLTYAYSQAGTLTLGFHDGRNQTDQTGLSAGGGPLTVAETQDQESRVVYGTVSHKITPKLTGSLTAEFQDSTFNGGTINNFTDRFYLLGLNFSYQFTHYISAELGYNYDRLDSDVAGRGYDRNRVYAGVTASY